MTIVTHAWFFAAARVIAGPPMSMVSMSGRSRERVEVRHDEVERPDAVQVEVATVRARCRGRRGGRRGSSGAASSTRWSSISGEPVTSSTVGRPGCRRRRAPPTVPPDDTSSTPSSCRPVRELDEPGLVVDREQRALDLRTRAHRSRSSHEPFDHVGIEPALDFLDAFVQGLLGVVVEDGHRLLGEDRAGVDVLGDEVHGAAR